MSCFRQLSKKGKMLSGLVQMSINWQKKVLWVALWQDSTKFESIGKSRSTGLKQQTLPRFLSLTRRQETGVVGPSLCFYNRGLLTPTQGPCSPSMPEDKDPLRSALGGETINWCAAKTLSLNKWHHVIKTSQPTTQSKGPCANKLLAPSGALKTAPGRYPIPTQSIPHIALSVQYHMNECCSI